MKFQNILKVFLQKVINTASEFLLLISVGAFIALFIEETNDSITTTHIFLGFGLVAVLRTIIKVWQDSEKGDSNVKN